MNPRPAGLLLLSVSVVEREKRIAVAELSLTSIALVRSLSVQCPPLRAPRPQLTFPLLSFTPAFSFPTSFEFYDPRPHPEDYLSDHPQARLHLVSSLLGPNRDHSSLRDPYISPAASPIPHGSFHSFPPTFLHYGDAERLEPEIDRLARAMRRDGVAVSVEKTRDAVHDVLILWLWDENVKGKIWRRIEGWLKQLEDSAEGVEGEK